MPKVLIIDDQESIVYGLQQVLISRGYEAESAFNAEEAFSKLESSFYHLVVSDLKMPGLSGLDFISKLKKDKYPLKVILPPH